MLKLHKGGASLREIADETNLGLRTLRTIVDQKRGTDRTTQKHRGRIDPSGVVTTWKRQRRTGQHLPRRAQAVVETGKALLKESQGPRPLDGPAPPRPLALCVYFPSGDVPRRLNSAATFLGIRKGPGTPAAST